MLTGWRNEHISQVHWCTGEVLHCHKKSGEFITDPQTMRHGLNISRNTEKLDNELGERVNQNTPCTHEKAGKERSMWIAGELHQRIQKEERTGK